MKTLIKKEIRLLLPAWIAAMLLAIVSCLFAILCAEYYYPNEPGRLSFLTTLTVAVGLLILGINSFGQELSCNTFSALLSQPMKRRRLWLVKIAILAAAFVSVWLVAILLVSWEFDISSPWSGMHLPLWRELLESLKSDDVEFLTLSALVTFSGGLWTTLLLRQTTTAFWITLLMPLAIICGVSVVLQERIAQGQSINTPIVAALVLYSIAGFFVARRLFMGAQDVQWAGREVSFPRREKTFKTRAISLFVRPRHWFSALAWKEIQLHQGTFLIAAIVLVLHLSAVFIRTFRPHIQNPDWRFALDAIWTIWLLMPVLIGAAAIAEERRMSTLEAQLCLPVSRPAQLFYKFIIALILSLFFGGLVPLLIEGTKMIGIGSWIFVVAGVLFFTSFYASSLARTTLQSVGLAALVVLAIYAYEAWTSWALMSLGYGSYTIELMQRYLDPFILVLVLGWLTFSNFKHVHQNWKFWTRNITAILAAFACVHLLDRAIQMAWYQWYIRHYQ